jgi:hypothetical protein
MNRHLEFLEITTIFLLTAIEIIGVFCAVSAGGLFR